MKNLTQNRLEQRDIQDPGKLDYNTVRAPYPLWNAEIQPLSWPLVTDFKLDILGWERLITLAWIKETILGMLVYSLNKIQHRRKLGCFLGSKVQWLDGQCTMKSTIFSEANGVLIPWAVKQRDVPFGIGGQITHHKIRKMGKSYRIGKMKKQFQGKSEEGLWFLPQDETVVIQ